MPIVYLGLGSNIGDKISYIQQAHKLLNDTPDITVTNSSSLYETEPCGVKEQDWFVNAALEVETTLSPEVLLYECQRIEKLLGRIRDSETFRWGPRTIDIDILFYDKLILATDLLQIPHPRLDKRAFMLVPLLELDPDFIHPIIKKSVLDIHSCLPAPEEVYLYGTRGLEF